MTKTDDIPQANDLHKVLRTVQLVAAGAITPAAIATALDMVERQGHYYITAARILGLVRDDGDGTVMVTDKGHRAIDDGRHLSKNPVVRNAIQSIDAMQVLVQTLKRYPSGVTEVTLHKAIMAETDLALSTVARRTSTLIAWLQVTGLVEERHERYYYTGPDYLFPVA